MDSVNVTRLNFDENTGFNQIADKVKSNLGWCDALELLIKGFFSCIIKFDILLKHRFELTAFHPETDMDETYLICMFADDKGNVVASLRISKEKPRLGDLVGPMDSKLTHGNEISINLETKLKNTMAGVHDISMIGDRLNTANYIPLVVWVNMDKGLKGALVVNSNHIKVTNESLEAP